jgi:hypothetical protein
MKIVIGMILWIILANLFIWLGEKIWKNDKFF